MLVATADKLSNLPQTVYLSGFVNTDSVILSMNALFAPCMRGRGKEWSRLKGLSHIPSLSWISSDYATQCSPLDTNIAAQSCRTLDRALHEMSSY